MISGVVTVEFRYTKHAAVSRTVRVLVRNAEHMHEVLVRGVGAAMDLAREHERGWHITASNFELVEFDHIA